ncbi:MAG: pyrroline-5-carboxylate reductase [Candidatus Hydrogenedentales bacterium]|jgi:pyrroline-5-carboxylate reductase
MNALRGKVGFLGYGNMGEAILSGLLKNQVLPPQSFGVYDPLITRREAAAAHGVKTFESATDLIPHCDTLLIAVKPQHFDEATESLVGTMAPSMRVVSIMAGISITRLQARFGDSIRVLRVMPNTPALVGAGASALACSDNCSPEDVDAGKIIFSAVGIVEVVQEADMDAVTALSGSGPAYFFYLTECMIKGAVSEGLPQDLAEHLAAQTLLGAGQLLNHTGKSAALLREQVTSKGGTTFAALETMRHHHFESLVSDAIKAAAKRSRELGSTP